MWHIPFSMLNALALLNWRQPFVKRWYGKTLYLKTHFAFIVTHITCPVHRVSRIISLADHKIMNIEWGPVDDHSHLRMTLMRLSPIAFVTIMIKVKWYFSARSEMKTWSRGQIASWWLPFDVGRHSSKITRSVEAGICGQSQSAYRLWMTRELSEIGSIRCVTAVQPPVMLS